MTWAKLDDGFPEHPKTEALSHIAFRLHVTALCWCCRWLTDGFIPDDRIPRFSPRPKASHLAELTAGERPMWERVEGGYQIRDFLDYQQSAESVRAKRAEAAGRMRRKRAEPPSSHNRSHEQDAKFAPPVPDPVPKTPPPQSSSAQPDPNEDPRVRDACDVIANRKLRDRWSGEPVVDIAAWKKTAAGNAYTEHAVTARALLAADPTLTPVELSRVLEGCPMEVVRPYKPPPPEGQVAPAIVHAYLREARAVVGR